MNYTLAIVETAEIDINHICEYISQRSSRGAVTWFEAFEKCTQRISVQPLSCGLAMESKELKLEIREAIFNTRSGDPYRCVFCIVGNEDRILRVRGRGQPPLDQSDIVLR